MRTLIMLVAFACALLSGAGCGKHEKNDSSGTQPPIPRSTGLTVAQTINPRAQFKRTATPGEKPRSAAARNILLSADGKRVVVVGPYDVDRSQLWSIDGQPRKLSDFDGLVTLLLPDGKRALCQLDSLSPNKGLVDSIVDLETGQKTPGIGLSGQYSFVAGNYVISPGISHVWDRPGPFQIFLYDLQSGKKLEPQKVGNDDRVRAAPINKGREILYVLPRENRGAAYDWKEKKTTREFKLAGKAETAHLDHSAWTDLRVSQPDGKWIAVSRTFGTPPEIFDGRTGELAATIPDPIAGSPGQFIPGKDIFIFNTYKNGQKGLAGMAAYDIKAQKYVAYFQGHTSPIVHSSISGDGRVMATDHEDGSILIWDLGQIK